MKKTVTVFAMLVLLLGMIAHPSFAFNAQQLTPEALALGDEGVVNNPLSGCFWGLYIDDRGPGLGPWDSLLFLSNPSPSLQNYDVINFALGRRVVNSFALRPDQLISLTCEQLGVCNSSGWLLIVSDASFFGGSLFLINFAFAGGSFTAQTPFCFSF